VTPRAANKKVRNLPMAEVILMNRADYSLLFSPISALKFLLGFKVRTDGRLDTVALRQAAGALLQHGVRELVVIPSATLMAFSLTYRRQRVPATPKKPQSYANWRRPDRSSGDDSLVPGLSWPGEGMTPGRLGRQFKVLRRGASQRTVKLHPPRAIAAQ